jgi:hypothetical protein
MKLRCLTALAREAKPERDGRFLHVRSAAWAAAFREEAR